MGKSPGNCIYLSDSADGVAKKVKGMYTDPGHLRVEDPGKVEGNPVFIYLDAFDPDVAAVQELKDHYTRGGLGDSVVKKRLNDVLQTFWNLSVSVGNLRKGSAAVLEILRQGTERANVIASQTLVEVRKAMHLDY